MESMGRNEGIRQATGFRRLVRLWVIGLFALSGAGICGSCAVPVLNGLANGLTGMFSVPPPPGAVSPVEVGFKPQKPSPKTSPPGMASTGSPGGSQKAPKPLPKGAASGIGPAQAPTYNQTPLNIIPFALLGAIFGGFIGTKILNGLERLGAIWDRMELGDRVNAF